MTGSDSPLWVAVTTAPSDAVAEALAILAIDRQLAACAQVEGPVRSTYRWQGAVETASEWRVTFKTTAAVLPRLTEAIHHAHPYAVPQWLAWPAPVASPAYAQWVVEQTAGAAPAPSPDA